MLSYAAGLPFFRHALEGDVLFNARDVCGTAVALHQLAGTFRKEHDRAVAIR